MEVLQLLYENQARSWSAEEIGEKIYQTPDQARAILSDLKVRGLIGESDVQHKYVIPVSGNAANTVNRLVSAYRANVYQVATLIHQQGTRAVREFARAFDLRNRKP